MGFSLQCTDSILQRYGGRYYDQNRSDGGYDRRFNYPGDLRGSGRGGRAITFFCLAAGPAAGSAATTCTNAQSISISFCVYFVSLVLYVSSNVFFSANCVYICPVVRFFLTFQLVKKNCKNLGPPGLYK
jgi:hypothetical protein